MAVSTDAIGPCSEPSPQPTSPSSVDTLTNSQLHLSIQEVNVSIFAICMASLRSVSGMAERVWVVRARRRAARHVARVMFDTDGRCQWRFLHFPRESN